MNQATVHKVLVRVLILLAAVALVGLGVALGPMAFANRAQAAAPATGSGAPSAPDGGPFTCVIANIAVFSNRIHVYCASPVSGTSIRYFAAPGDSAHALATNRFLVILNTAYALGRPVYIYYPNSATQNPPGCNATDCRAIDWMFIVP